MDVFRESFKYYKSRRPEPSFAEIINFDSCDNASCVSLEASLRDRQCEDALGIDPHEFQCFALPVSSRPVDDFLVLRNPFTPAAIRSLIEECLTCHPSSSESRNNMENQVSLSVPSWWDHCKSFPQDLKKLRWVTLGYHHDWDTKVYSEERKGMFPENLGKLFRYLSRVLGFSDDFAPEAAIVNYYPWDSTLSAHTDHSEINFEAPLFSLSLGQSAIFLIGGQEKNIKPAAVALHCGDVAVMFGSSRLSYHAVPRIFKAPTQPWIDECPSEWLNEFGDYVENNRINLNTASGSLVLQCFHHSCVMYWCDFWSGWIGGISGILVGHPLDTVKVRQQAFGSKRALGLRETIIATFRFENSRGFFKGMEFPLLASGVLNSMVFGTYGVCMGEVMKKQRHESPTVLDAFLCGCFAGFVQISVCCPVEVVKIKLQTQTAEGAAVRTWGSSVHSHYAGPWSCLKDVWARHGLRGCYRASGCMLFRDIPSSGIYMAVYHGLLNKFGDKPEVHIIGGGVAGMLSWASIMPFDLVKSRMQADDFDNPRYRGTWDCLQKSVRSDGWRVLYRGFSATMLRAFPVNAAIFYAYDWSRKECFALS